MYVYEFPVSNYIEMIFLSFFLKMIRSKSIIHIIIHINQMLLNSIVIKLRGFLMLSVINKLHYYNC